MKRPSAFRKIRGDMFVGFILVLSVAGACPHDEFLLASEVEGAVMHASPILTCDRKKAPLWWGGMSFVTTLTGAYRSWEEAGWWMCVVHTERELVMVPMRRESAPGGAASFRVDLMRRQTEPLRLSEATHLHLVCRLLGDPDPRYVFRWELKDKLRHIAILETAD